MFSEGEPIFFLALILCLLLLILAIVQSLGYINVMH